jgi:hypothetical protein
MLSKWGKVTCVCGKIIDKEFKWSKYCSIKCQKLEGYNRRILKGRKNDILKKFGINKSEYECILEKQNGRCAICGEKESALASNKKQIKELAVDHCHKTGTNRGLLCMKCNNGIGNFNDDIVLLEKAIKYLKKKHSQQNGNWSNCGNNLPVSVTLADTEEETYPDELEDPNSNYNKEKEKEENEK